MFEFFWVFLLWVLDFWKYQTNYFTKKLTYFRIWDQLPMMIVRFSCNLWKFVITYIPTAFLLRLISFSKTITYVFYEFSRDYFIVWQLWVVGSRDDLTHSSTESLWLSKFHVFRSYLTTLVIFFSSFEYKLDIRVKIALIFSSNRFFPFVFPCLPSVDTDYANVLLQLSRILLNPWDYHGTKCHCCALSFIIVLSFVCCDLLIVFVNASMSEIVGAGIVYH